MNRHDWISGSCLRFLGYGMTDNVLRNQLLSQGLTPGVMIRVVRSAPFNGPIQIELRGVMLGLRRDDLQSMQWMICDE